jgi:SPP1 family phage portal protein
MPTTGEIKEILQRDQTSLIKQAARTGQRYYEGEHDIKGYRLFYYNATGQLTEDTTKSNIKIPHPFFTELVDQQVQYMLSGGRFIKSGLPELDEALRRYFGDRFVSECGKLLRDTVVQGWGYVYAYKDMEGETRFVAASGLGVIEVRAKDTSDAVDCIIRYYRDRMVKDNTVITHIEVWGQNMTTYYVQEGDGDIELDADEPINPRPHILYTREDDKAEDLYYEDLGYIPFFRLDNSEGRRGNLPVVKALIDDYDLMSCGLSNNLQDLVEGIYAVKGYTGDNLDELITNIRTKKVVGVDADGGLDVKTVQIPYEARRVKLELDEKNIYRFGMGLNSAQVGDGNITNIVIKSRYALLDLKCNKLEDRLRAFLWPLVDIALAEINAAQGTGYTQDDVGIEFEREIVTNALDNANIEQAEAQTASTKVNTLLSAAAVLGDDVAAEQIANALGLDWEDIQLRMPADPAVPDNDTAQAGKDLAAGTPQLTGSRGMYAVTSVLLKYANKKLTYENALDMLLMLGVDEEKAKKYLNGGAEGVAKYTVG